MTDRDAFRRAVCERPDDDTPRLVFADWLDEHGDPKRAEFIRLQIEAEQVEEFGPRWRVLAKREDRLLTPNRAKWSKDLDGLAVLNADFRRGFVHEVTIYSKRFVADHEKLFAAAPVRRVKFADLTAARGNVPLDGLLLCPALARLTELDLSNSPLPGEAVERVAGCERLRGLRALALSVEHLTPAACRAVLRSKPLEGVTDLTLLGDLEGGMDGNDLVAALAKEPGLRRIARLTLRGVGTGPVAAKALAKSPHAAGLKYLAITGISRSAATRLGPTGAEALAASPHLSGLTALVIHSQQIGVAGLKALAASPRLAGLRHLDLSSNPFTPSMTDALLASETLPNLISLEIDGCNVVPDAVSELRAKFSKAAVVNDRWHLPETPA